MSVWKSLAMVSATLALAAPAANATYDRGVPAKTTHAKVKAAKKVKHQRPATSGGRVVVITANIPATGQATGTDYDCAVSGNDCSDEQNCLIWGLNCEVAFAATPAVPETAGQSRTG